MSDSRDAPGSCLAVFPNEVDAETRWQVLSECSPPPGSRPAAVRFPDGSVVKTENWGDFIAGLVWWLRVSRHLTDGNLPIRFGSQTYDMISATSPSRPGFHGSGTYRQIGEWYVKTSYTAHQQVLNSRRLIELAGLDPGDFAVRLQ